VAILGVDVGGTFTDAVLLDGDRLATAKVPTDADQAESVLAAARTVGAARVERFTHGTTIATNALLERTGATTALVATEGFEHVLHLRRQARAHLYRLCEPHPEPLVPLERCFGVRERLGSAVSPESRTPSRSTWAARPRTFVSCSAAPPGGRRRRTSAGCPSGFRPSTCTPSAPAAARSRGSTPAARFASARGARARIRGPRATAAAGASPRSPTRTCSSAACRSGSRAGSSSIARRPNGRWGRSIPPTSWP